MARVLVVGGGLAGCSAALALADAGWQVTLAEKRATLGGRASSFRAPGWEQPLDTSQHVLLRCCTHLTHYYQRLGVAEQITWHDRLPLVAGNGQRGLFRAWPPPLAPPLHLAPGLAALPGLNARDRLCLAAAFQRMMLVGRRYRELEGITFQQWLGRTTTAALDRTFWRLLLTSVLNAGAATISAAAGIMFFLEGLLRHRDGFQLGVPQVSLHALHHDAALAALRAGGVTVQLGSAVRLPLAAGRLAGWDAAICAVPWWQVERVVPELLPAPSGRGRSTAFPALQPAAIVGVHLRFAEPVLSEPLLGLLDHDIDWVFASHGGRQLSLVVSAADSWAGLSPAALTARALTAVRGVLGDLPDPLRTAACREARATFIPAPGLTPHRPGPRTPLPGVYLAGEWTATGWPSTMEGAVRSGHAAAAAILDRPTGPSDLPRQGLARVYLGAT